MDKEPKKPEFQWKSLGDSMPLPTDYSQSMLVEKWYRNRASIAKQITKNPIFEDFYKWMRYCRPEVPHSEAYKAKGVPAELEPFFYEYCVEADRSPQFAELYCGKVPPEFHHAFALHLHEKARAAEKRAKSDAAEMDMDMYWYRRLYENPEFQAEISREYWNREYEWRVQLLKDLSLTMPQAQQITQLKHLISFMDTEIAAMMSLSFGSEKEKPSEEKKTFLHTFPRQLIAQLRKRELYGFSANERVKYTVPDIPLSIDGESGITSMKQAFVAIKNKTLSPEAITGAVIPEYLKAVCSIPKKSEFQTVCEELQNYLDEYVAEYEDSAEINEYIRRRCAQYYGKILWNSIVPAGAIQSGGDQKHGVKLIVDELIASMYSHFIVDVYDEVQYLASASQVDISKHCEMYCYMLNSANNNGASIADIYKQALKQHKGMVSTLWDSTLFGSDEAIQKEVPQEQIDKLSAEMEIYCQNAYESFCGQRLPWGDSEYIKSLWDRYNEIQNTDDLTILPAGGDVRDIYLCAALLFCRVWAEYCRTAASAMNCYHQLTSYINKRKGGSL